MYQTKCTGLERKVRELRDACETLDRLADELRAGLGELADQIPDRVTLDGPFPGQIPDWFQPQANIWIDPDGLSVKLEGPIAELDRIEDALDKIRAIPDGPR